MAYRISKISVGLMVAFFATTTFAQEQMSKMPREVNITTDSAYGWLPSEAQDSQVLAAVKLYYATIDGGNYRGAYTMMAPTNQQLIPYEDYAANAMDFHAQSGSVIERRVLKVTWTKDPANAPFPGIYAAIDIAARFDNIDRYCGYIVLYQKNDADDFKVMREESNLIDNVTAKNIEQTKSRAFLNQTWAELSANCPNYPVN
ncbi:MAG: DUF4019 domain-containing protein [Asticcacaulis sp.]